MHFLAEWSRRKTQRIIEDGLKLRLRLFDINSASGTPTSMDLYRITQDWNWQTQGTGSDRLRLWWADQPSAVVQTSSLPAPTEGSYYYIDITDLYNQWQAGTLPNFGIELRPTSTNNNFDIFGSSRNATPTDQPALVITRSNVAQTTSQLSAISNGGNLSTSVLSADPISFADNTVSTLLYDPPAATSGPAPTSGLAGAGSPTAKLCSDPAAEGLIASAPAGTQIGELALTVPAPMLTAAQFGQHLGQWC